MKTLNYITLYKKNLKEILIDHKHYSIYYHSTPNYVIHNEHSVARSKMKIEITMFLGIEDIILKLGSAGKRFSYTYPLNYYFIIKLACDTRSIAQ